jgi:hypothetical protein
VTPSVHPPMLPNPVVGILSSAAVGVGAGGSGTDVLAGSFGGFGFDVGLGAWVGAGVSVDVGVGVSLDAGVGVSLDAGVGVSFGAWVGVTGVSVGIDVGVGRGVVVSWSWGAARATGFPSDASMPIPPASSTRTTVNTEARFIIVTLPWV